MAWYLHAKTQILYALPSVPRNFPNGNVHEQNVWILMREGGVVDQWVRGCPQDTHFFSYFLLGAYFFSTAPGKATDKDVFYSFSKEAGNGRV